MITQEYKTTLDAIRSRFRAGKIDRIKLEFMGATVTLDSPDALHVFGGAQTVHVREYRHDTHTDRYEEKRNLVLHDTADAPDGRLLA